MKPEISIYIALSPMYNLDIKYSIILLFNSKKIHLKEINGILKKTTKTRALLYAIIEALNNLKTSCKIKIFLYKSERKILHMNLKIQSKRLGKVCSTCDLWNNIIKHSEKQEISFTKVDENDYYYSMCFNNLNKEPNIMREDYFERPSKNKTFLIDNLFKSILKNYNVQLINNLDFCEFIILKFLLIYNDIYTEYAIAKILCGSKSLQFLSDEVKNSIYYGILKKIYSAPEIRLAIYRLINKKHLLEESLKKYYSKFDNNKNYLAIKISSNLSDLLKDELNLITEPVFQAAKYTN